ncbi:glycerol kinase [Patiriisocius marinistellae]|uniref:Glycerol kinase n=1 Tax=Patiriisocius marinistellae TaxID=2494560 RepID=A0A5J4FVF3_9FLAO|nr:glycerol kinase GlpK [Patiriisocius marinistellae]GEQ85883.1 glycerol kinase [Patiriisocius marinistellae]
MDGDYIIALDQGTTSTRSILFDTEGNIVKIFQKELTQYYPRTGWVEHDPMEIIKHQKETLQRLFDETNIQPNQVKAIGITNQRETTVVWDKVTGKPIYNAIVWLDNRSKAFCEQLKTEGFEDYVRENTGLVIDAYFSATKLHWILNNVPGAKEKAEAGELLFGTIDSWLIYNLTTEKNHLTDHTNASRTMLYNCKKLQWDEMLLKQFNIPKTMLPSVQTSSSFFGDVLINGTTIPIYGVAGDQQAALFGQGGFKSGIAKNTYGTGCFMLLNTGDKFVSLKNGLLTTIACSLPDQNIHYAVEGSIFIGGACIQWLRDKLNIIKEAQETETICNSIPPLEDVYVVPAFAGLGAPYWDAKAKGAIYGLTLDSGKAEIIKATVEALAYQTKDVLWAMQEEEGIKLKKLQVDGGASANGYLMQFQADILNVPVEKPKMIEVTALGAAFLAGIKAGIWRIEDISKLKMTETIYSPKMSTETRDKKYAGWKKAVERTREI